MNQIARIAANEKVEEAMLLCQQRVGLALDLAISIQQIPSPTFSEAERATYVESKFRDLGLVDVSQDAMHNVFARLPGQANGSPIILSAHSDTVFSHDTDLTVRYENGREPTTGLISGPGLADNALGVAGLLVIAGLLVDTKLRPYEDIWFVANVCEEGLGDLRGMRSVVERFGAGARYVIIEGGSYGHIFHKAIGVRRFRLTVKTPGGHSWGDYGSPNAIHILGQIIGRIDQLALPERPKTSINVGVVEGGTTINSIAAQASCLVDMRSVDPQMLEGLLTNVERIVAEIASGPDVNTTISKIGDRPAGELAPDTAMVALAAEALEHVGCQDIRFMAGSTDANIPISMGIESVCVGLANSGNTHRVDEFLDPTHLPEGLGQLLLLTLAAAGVEGAQT
ncbi:MAG: M20/M25/M40 family metallo-hydrolase [Chloroflexota bacterium]|nr:MAG: M20/M25/M40 family metallo-hydrolase [Chloroflexota bacterium]